MRQPHCARKRRCRLKIGPLVSRFNGVPLIQTALTRRISKILQRMVWRRLLIASAV